MFMRDIQLVRIIILATKTFALLRIGIALGEEGLASGGRMHLLVQGKGGVEGASSSCCCCELYTRRGISETRHLNIVFFFIFCK